MIDEKLVLLMMMVVGKIFHGSLVRDCRVDAIQWGFRCMVGGWMMHIDQVCCLAVEHGDPRWLHVRDRFLVLQVVVVSFHDELAFLELVVLLDCMLAGHKR